MRRNGEKKLEPAEAYPEEVRKETWPNRPGKSGDGDGKRSLKKLLSLYEIGENNYDDNFLTINFIIMIMHVLSIFDILSLLNSFYYC